VAFKPEPVAPPDRLPDAGAAFAPIVESERGTTMTDPLEELSDEERAAEREQLEKIAEAQHEGEKLTGISPRG
jgi:hypothetical protein